MKSVKRSKSITSKSKIPEIKKLQSQIDNLQVQIADYQQIVKELSDRIELLKKFV
jgi:flagellar biosynthesis chaperone FliJ